jgi:hypothetical protein
MTDERIDVQLQFRYKSSYELSVVIEAPRFRRHLRATETGQIQAHYVVFLLKYARQRIKGF